MFSRESTPPYLACCAAHAIRDAAGVPVKPPLQSEPERDPGSLWRNDLDPDALLTATSDERPILIRDVHVISMVDSRVRHDMDVLVENGVIVRIGHRLPAAATAFVVEGNGAFLLPALSDMHAHILTWPWVEAFGFGDRSADVLLSYPSQMLQWLLLGVSRVQVMAGDQELLQIRAAVASGDVLGPDLVVNSPIIDGDPPIFPTMCWLALTPQQGRDAVRRAVSERYDRLKVYNSLSRETYAAIADEARSCGVPLDGHVPHAVGVDAAIDAGQALIAHVSQFVTSIAPPRVYSREDIARLAEKAARAGTWVHTTMTVVDRLQRLAHGQLTGIWNDSSLDYCHAVHRRMHQPDSAAITGLRSGASHQRWSQVRDRSLEVLSDLRRSGVRLLGGTDVLNVLLVDGFALHDELQYLVETGGMTPFEALETVTTKPAELLAHRDGGSIGEGKCADLLLLRGNPLLDIRATRSIVAVMKRGRLIGESHRTAALAALRAAHAACASRLVPGGAT